MSKTPDNLKKHTLLLRHGDWDKLVELYPDVPTSVVIRHIVASAVDRAMGPNEPIPAINLPEVRI